MLNLDTHILQAFDRLHMAHSGRRLPETEGSVPLTGCE